MYTHIERWWLSVLLLLTGREKDQCRGGFCRRNYINTIIFTPTHTPVLSAFAKLSRHVLWICPFFLLYMPFLWVWVDKESWKTHNWTKKLSLAKPSVYRAVPHVHTLQSPWVAESGFKWIGPLGKAGLSRELAEGGGGIIVAGSEKEAQDETEKGIDCLEGLIIPMMDCLVTVIVQKY